MPRKRLIVLALALLPLSAWAQSFGPPVRTTCCYSDKARHISLSKRPCMLGASTLNGNFVYTIKFPNGPTVTVEYTDVRDEPLDYADDAYIHHWKINGQPGKGYEPNRVQLHGETEDKNQTVAFDDPD